MSRTAGRSPLRFRLAAGAAIAAFGLPVLAGITGFTGLPAATAQTANEPPEWVTETPAQRTGCATRRGSLVIRLLDWSRNISAARHGRHPSGGGMTRLLTEPRGAPGISTVRCHHFLLSVVDQ